MAVQLSFQSMFDHLLGILKSSNKVVDVSSHFGSEKSFDEMICYILDLEEIDSQFNLNVPSALRKDPDNASRLRLEGNQLFKFGNFSRAIILYNESIINSIHESPTTGNCENIQNNIALCFANRSAVLFELGLYEKCLNDISRSLKHGYPLILKSKLFERKAKCFISEGRLEEARQVLEDCIIDLKNLGIDDSKMTKTYSSLENLKSICNNKNSKVDWSKHNMNLVREQFLLPSFDIPVLKKQNSAVPSLSSAVSVSFSPENGRYLTANRDIYPGELLICERSFASIVLPSSLHTHCSSCLKRTYLPIPCPLCNMVVFCDENCQKLGCETFHNMECNILPVLIQLDMGMNAILAVRLIILIGLKNLKKSVGIYSNEHVNNDVMNLSFNEEGIYSSYDYRTIYNLVMNKESRTVSDLFKRAAMANILLKLLEKTTYFDRNPNREDKFLVCKVLFIHLMNLPCNAHSITELGLNKVKYPESHIEEIGAGAYGVMSLTNHSCNPTVNRTCYGSIIGSRAIMFIPKGSEISDSYGQHYAIQSLESRKNYLKQQYRFTCACQACAENWQTYKSLNENIEFKCSKCQNKVVSNDLCIDCTSSMGGIDRIDLDFSSDDTTVRKEIECAVDTFQSSYDKILIDDVEEEDVKNTTHLITLLSKHAKLPCKKLFEAQETLKHCFDRKGSHYIVMSSSQ